MNPEFYHTSPSQAGGPMAIMLALMIGAALFIGVAVMLVLPLG